MIGRGRQGVPSHRAWRHTAQGARWRTVQGEQQSDVCVHPSAKNGMQEPCTQTPVTSGLLCWQTRPGPQTGGWGKMFPPHGPPRPETHPHGRVGVAIGNGSHVAPVGHAPPHMPPASTPQGGAIGIHAHLPLLDEQTSFGPGQTPPQTPLASIPHGLTQRSAGPGQQFGAPVASRHRHACSHTPLSQ